MDMPDEYWVVKTTGSCYYLSDNEAAKLRVQLQAKMATFGLVSFTDLAGCDCYITIHSFTDLFSSTPVIREYERAFVKKMNDEVPSVKDPWE